MTIPSRLQAVSGAVVLAGAILALPPVAGRIGSREPSPNVPARSSYDYGEQLFFHETFGGNGRTCATCHDPRNEFTVSPDLVEKRYEADPAHPLFRPQDSDDGAGRDYTTVRTRAVFRVTVPLHPNVIFMDDPRQRTITVWRGVPMIANVDLTGPYLVDGRAATLQEQALGAIRGHMDPRHRPLDKELDALAAFESELYYPLKIRALEDDDDPVPKEPGFSIPLSSPAALRGKASFDLHCRSCHDGELGDRPSNADQSPFANVFVSDDNKPNFPILRLGFRQPDGTVVVAETPDPGRAAITGDLADLNRFDTPPLRGLKHTAPYFHDNSAATLDQVVDHYNDHFQMQIGASEKADLITYLEAL